MSSIASSLSPSTLLIVDYGSPLKSWRYEVHCLARSAGVRFGLIYTGLTPGAGVERGELGQYPVGWKGMEERVEQIRYSFEIPNPTRDRWDRPLYLLEKGEAASKGGMGGETSAFDQVRGLRLPERRTS